MSISAPSRRDVLARPRWALLPPRRATATASIPRLIIAASLLLPLFVLAGGSYLSWRAELAQARLDLRRKVDLVHENLARVSETWQLLIKGAAAAIGDASDSAILEHEKQLHRALGAILGNLPQAKDLFIIGADGHPLVSARVFPAIHANSLADRDYVRQLTEDRNGFAVGAVQSGRIDRNPFLRWPRPGKARTALFEVPSS
jgi:hypothetical protein